MKELYIIGAGGFSREVVWLVERINAAAPTWQLQGFIDDNEALWGTVEAGYPVLGGSELLIRRGAVYAVCAVGAAATRKKIVEQYYGSEVKFATLIDPSALCSRRVRIGEGTIVCAGSILTVDIEIGRHVIINLGCTIGHDGCIQDFVTIYPGVNVSGNVLIGECAELGTGMQIIQGKKVAPNTIVGAGAVVVSDIKESGTYVGCPAKRIK